MKMACAITLVFFIADLRGQSVSERRGNIIAIDSQGREQQITSSGRDSDPHISPDKRSVVFVRRGEGSFDSDIQPVGTKVNQIWIADLLENPQPRVVLENALSINGRQFHEFTSPQLSPDNAAVYFLIPYAATSRAIIRYERATAKVEFIAGTVLEFNVVPSGKNAGSLIVHERRLMATPAYWEPYWLLDPHGADRGFIGLDSKAVTTFLNTEGER
jgi:hypothetical protein